MNLTWKQADHDLYVATTNGEYAGFVAMDGTAHVLHDRHSRRVGDYPSLSAARSAAESAVTPSGARRRDRRRTKVRTLCH